ncbi:MAG: formate dehydrogenase subunit alpha [Syntrophus sp. RIFOXYC2_FULL_54_9]|nr:MAG: formate dehydrogenase subunit alpha [Syntrophus sp. GWC2_56_31]OHE31152.1 MAG: formate dehydrogenase subunit alpha [Syntrophus sp. RIFOXYC2_FULL_54_9]
MTNSIEEIEHTDLILAIGTNTTENHPVIGAKVKKAVRSHGAKLIVIDPRDIALTGYADIWLRQRPGTDVAVLNGLMQIIISEDLYDRDYVAARTEGFAELKKTVARYTPEYVEKISGVKAEDLGRAARMYATAGKAAILYCMGMTQHVSGTDNVKSIANLAMLCGKVGIEGGGVNPLRGQNNVQGACDMGALPDVFTAYQKVAVAEQREKFSRAWGVPLPAKPGLTVVEMMHGATEGTIRGMYIMGENPMLSDPDLSHVESALRKLDFLVVQDIFLTETAKLAHVVLPSACFAEKEGTFTNTERRVQRVRKAVSAPGEARADWEIITGLANRFGYPMQYAGPAQIMEEINSLTPSYGGITCSRIEKEGIQWPCPSPDHPGTKFLHGDKFTRGLGLFHAIDYREPAELPDDEYPLLLTTGRVLYHYHTGTMTRLAKGTSERCPESLVEINPQDADRIGIESGKMVVVSSRRGRVTAKAAVTSRSPEGVVFMNFHFREAAVNLLTNPALDPIAKIPEYKVCAVRVEAA